MGIIGVLVGAFIAAGFDIGGHAQGLAVACGVIVAFIAGGNSLNDYTDREIDKAAHPERPLPRGEIAPRTALALGISGLAVALLLSLAMGSVVATGIVAAAAALMASYELALKKMGFVGNVTIAALTGMIFLFGGAAVGNAEGGLVVAAMAALVSVGREIAKDIQDMESDEGRNTLPMAIGRRNASAVAAAFFVSGTALSVWPFIEQTFGPLYCAVFAADAIFIYSAFIIFRRADVSQKMAKIAMFVALIAFVLGVIRWA